MRSYRPSSGMEGEVFAERWCENCVHEDIENDKFCPIRDASMSYLIDDPKYPCEWIYGDDGEPICTKFKRWVI